MFGAGRGNFLQIFGVAVAFFFLFGDGDRDIATVFDHVAECFEAGFESGHPHRGWSHVHAAARLAEIEWDTDNANLSGGNVSGSRCSHHGLDIDFVI